MYIFKAGVVGAGTMGGEIAQVISFSGLPVVLKDVDPGRCSTAAWITSAIFTKAGWIRVR